MAKQCQNYGQRVQNSVFECILDPVRLKNLQASLAKIIDEEKSSIRYYYLGDEWRSRVEHVGAKKSIDLEGPLNRLSCEPEVHIEKPGGSQELAASFQHFGVVFAIESNESRKRKDVKRQGWSNT